MENKKIYFIDIIYYNCYNFYSKYEKDLNEYSGQVLTTVCLSLNIVSVFVLLQEFFEIKIFENKWNTLFLTLPILLIIILRYNKFIKINEVKKTMHSYDSNKQIRLNIIAFIYILLSIFGSIILFIILGELNNPPPFWERI